MTGLVNYAWDSHSVGLREMHILNRVSLLKEGHETFKEMHSGKIVKGVLKP